MAIVHEEARGRTEHPGFTWPADSSKDVAHVCVWQCKRCGQTTPPAHRSYGLNEIWQQQHIQYECAALPEDEE